MSVTIAEVNAATAKAIPATPEQYVSLGIALALRGLEVMAATRERALCKTKLQEAEHWLQEHVACAAASAALATPSVTAVPVVP